MSEGWDKIQIERGWSLFIGGAAALAGGAVTLALGAVLQRLDRLLAAARQPRRNARRTEPASADAPTPTLSSPRQDEAALRHREKEVVEVDSYVSGDTTYVMFSDGSVEVRNSSGAQSFSSLAELKARAAGRL